MEIHVIDVSDIEACILDGHRHRAPRFHSRFVEAHAMIGIAGRRVSEDLGIDRRAASSRGGLGLDHVYPCAFAEHKPVAILREWA